VFYLFHIFRSFVPQNNPIGFGASDMVEFAIAAALFGGLLCWNRVIAFARALAHRTAWCMLAVGALPVVLRLAMLPVTGVPIPSTADDTSYLLLADTLSHFRLANPMHPLHRFFETNFVLQDPTYSSIFPLGQGIALAFGRAIFTHPWAGVLLTEALFCALCYWMLRAWIPPTWALLGGILCVVEFGPLNYWMNTYWGGAVSGIAGCLVFGALPRLREKLRTRDAILLGAGLSLQLLTRPYECVFLFGIAAIFLLIHNRRAFLPTILATLPVVALTLAQNHAVTGHWTTLPYIQSRAQYGVPATFTTQPNATPHIDLSQEQRDDYRAQVEVHDRESSKSFAGRLADRLPYARFFLLPSLLIALPAFFFARRDNPLRWWAPGAIAVFALAANFYPYFHPHYLAATACLFVLMSLIALRRLNPTVSKVLVLLASAHFVFWYGLHAWGDPQMLASVGQFESFDFVNHGDPEGRLPILNLLRKEPGNQLVFVRFSHDHPLREWIFNDADIDRSRVVWALDLSPSDNQLLSASLPNRRLWLVEPDARPPRIVPYRNP
jgi:hypothetical protein